MDDLIKQLRDDGHDAEADSLERKQEAGRLRAMGRADLADRLAAEPTEPANASVVTSKDTAVSGSTEDEQVAAVTAALDRDVPGWRG